MANERRSGTGYRSRPPAARLDTSKIVFSEIDPELFNTVAKEVATTVSSCPNHLNRPTQLRKFYDELCMWDAKMKQGQDAAAFEKNLPFIRMINAKVAYAKGRKLVDDNYATLLTHCLGQVKTVSDFATCKLFMEAFMGFYKAVRPK